MHASYLSNPHRSVNPSQEAAAAHLSPSPVGPTDGPKAEAEESYLAGLADGRTTVEEEEGACEHTWERPLGTGGGHATRFALRVICAKLPRERKGERPPSAICSLEAA